MPASAEARRRLAYFAKRRDEIISTIRDLVEIESPSDNKAAVDRVAEAAAEKFSRLGGKVRFHRAKDFGSHLQVNFGGKSGKPVLLLGHYDTVYPLGTLATMPCRIEHDRLTGPGVLDMKSGIALMLHALAALQEWNSNNNEGRPGELLRPVTVLLVSDEEVGSNSSRAITEALAKQAAAVLVFEPSYGRKGAVKTARKGVGEYLVKVIGKAAHAGLDFEKGANAILELARQIQKLSGFTELKKGLTVNVGVVSGGSRTNVVPSEATARVDVRIARLKDAAGIDKKMRALRPFNRKCKIEITGGINRPPMERTAGVAALYAQAAVIGRELGWKLDEAAVGGGSDGNFTAGLGIPTLDGLGGVGDGAHATHEHILISELPRRAALIAGLIERA
ncbi:MAG TPA: M20 family metallopeptidase [Terriglobales bacterium]|jgi:glutamate carboxypeptidase|nr:M20 family metallopeptidase [Terriglobales bacterium]